MLGSLQFFLAAYEVHGYLFIFILFYLFLQFLADT